MSTHRSSHNSSKSFQIPSKCMHIIRDIVFKMFSAVQNSFNYRHNTCFKDIVFKMFSAVQNSFNYRHSTCFKDIVFKMFSAFPNRFKYLQNAYFRGIAPGSYTSHISDLIIWSLCFVVRPLFQTSQNVVMFCN